MPGAYVWKKVLGQVSLRIGALLGDLGREMDEGDILYCVNMSIQCIRD